VGEGSTVLEILRGETVRNVRNVDRREGSMPPEILRREGLLCFIKVERVGSLSTSVVE
jgi:hypothetical protein